MNHIYFLHSNICTIVAFKTIKELIEKGDNVVIILNRGTKFPFFEGKVRIFDIQYITDEYRKSSSNVIGKYLNYRFHYLPLFDETAKEIIGEEEFILYAPSYNLFILRYFFNSSYLKGYYYLEEGTLSYTSKKLLLRRYYKKIFLKGRLVSGLLGLREYFDSKVTKKFKGCICLSDQAFQWLSYNKTISTIDDYLYALDEPPLIVDALIVTGYLNEDILELYKGLDSIFAQIRLKNQKSVAVKFHPTAASYQREKCKQIKTYLTSKYTNTEILFVNTSYSLEGSLYQRKTDLYSIFGMSSLCLYSLIFGSRSYVINRETPKEINEVSSVENFMYRANA